MRHAAGERDRAPFQVRSEGAETRNVARAIFQIAFWGALVISAETRGLAAGEAAIVPPSPFERRFQDLPAPDQRLFRSIQEGIVEAERSRAATGRWPDVATLAAAGVPPFAPDPLDGAKYTWELVQTGRKADYIGNPTAESGRASFFVVVAEPEPGMPDDPLARVDEVHHRLANGPMIHVSVWMGPRLAETKEAFSLLPVERYQQVYASPSPPGL